MPARRPAASHCTDAQVPHALHGMSVLGGKSDWDEVASTCRLKSASLNATLDRLRALMAGKTEKKLAMCKECPGLTVLTPGRELSPIRVYTIRRAILVMPALLFPPHGEGSMPS